VDTLRQRQQGRGPALESALRRLLERHYWAFCGFSGADLDFDPEYLGFRAAAVSCPGLSSCIGLAIRRGRRFATSRRHAETRRPSWRRHSRNGSPR
jgi:hypothetical protein